MLSRFEMPSSAILLTASLASFAGVFLLEARSRARGVFQTAFATASLLVRSLRVSGPAAVSTPPPTS